MTTDWKALEARLGTTDLEAFTKVEVQPRLDALSEAGTTELFARDLKTLTGSFSLAFGAFGIVFFLMIFAFPDVWWGTVLRFVLFPVLFFGSFLFAAFLKRKTIARLLIGGTKNFAENAASLRRIAGKLGLTYVSAPGGAPESLRLARKIPFLKSELGRLIEEMDRNGGHEEVIQVAVRSGLLMPNVYVAGSAEARDKYDRQANEFHKFQDGFEGEIDGIRFSALEWVEKVEKADDKFHLLIVLKSPYRLHGETQLRSRQIAWQIANTSKQMDDVNLVPDTFNDHFRLRGTDQVEARTLFNPAVVERVIALSRGKPFRAVASGGHLVIDVVGDNRFSLIDMTTGVWSEDTIFQTYTDIAEMLELVREMAHAFMVRK